MEETPTRCMYFGKSNEVCGDPVVWVTKNLYFQDGCEGMICVCNDRKHWPDLKLYEPGQRRI